VAKFPNTYCLLGHVRGTAELGNLEGLCVFIVYMPVILVGALVEAIEICVYVPLSQSFGEASDLIHSATEKSSGNVA